MVYVNSLDDYSGLRRDKGIGQKHIFISMNLFDATRRELT